MSAPQTTIGLLADHPGFVPVIARWLFDEFGYLIPGKTLPCVEESLRARMNRDRIPLCLVALRGVAPVGTVSLKESDMDSRTELTPWLAGLFVRPDLRGAGLGARLVGAIMEEASRLGAHELFLYTPSAA